MEKLEVSLKMEPKLKVIHVQQYCLTDNTWKGPTIDKTTMNINHNIERASYDLWMHDSRSSRKKITKTWRSVKYANSNQQN